MENIDIETKFIDDEVKEYIYRGALKVKRIRFYNKKSTINEVLEYICSRYFVGFCYQLCFVLAPLYKDAKMVRGVIFNPDYYEHCWLEILVNDEWYVFDPALNIVKEKIIYDSLYTPVRCSEFTSDEIRNYYLEHITKKGLFSSSGIIHASGDTCDINYGNNLKFSLKMKNNNISEIKADYIY